MHFNLLQLDQQVPTQRDLQASWMNDGRCASADAAKRCAGAASRGNGAHSFVPVVAHHEVDGARLSSVRYVHRSYSASGVLIVAADHCQN